MENTSLIALSRANALRRQMELVANNVANMSTTGFKSEQPLFIEYINRPQTDEKYSMVQDRATLRDLASGPLTQTGNTLDMAIEGDGYFAVDTVDGTRYTRNGNFTMNEQRELTTSSGLPVLDDTGNTITFPQNATDFRVTPEGNVFAGATQVGKLGIYKFQNEQFMTQLGSGLYQTDQQAIASDSIIVRQGFLEGSNVQPIMEMNNMIEVNRQYQNIQNLLKTEHDRLRSAYSKLAKLA